MRRIGCLLLLGAAGACSDDAAPRVQVFDDGGVRVTLTADDTAVFAELDSLPAVSIGGPDVSGPTRFFRIQAVHVDPGGRLWVADGQSGELRIFHADGSHWKTRGGRGEGPGEFVQIRLLGAPDGDSVLVGDGRIDRITVFDPNGDLVRTERVPSSDRPAPRLFDVFPDGSVLGQRPRIVATASLEAGQILTDSVELVRVRPGSSVAEPYGTAPGPLWLWTGRNQVPLPFTISASFAAFGNAVHLVSGPDFRIRVYEEGQLRETYGVDRPPRAVEEADTESYRAFVDEYVPEAMRRDYLSALDHELRPDVLPAYDRVLVSGGGHVWAQIYEPDLAAPHRWDVFDADREFAGQVRVPGGFYPMAVTREAVVGVWRDSLGIEQVRSYGATRIGEDHVAGRRPIQP